LIDKNLGFDSIKQIENEEYINIKEIHFVDPHNSFINSYKE